MNELRPCPNLSITVDSRDFTWSSSPLIHVTAEMRNVQITSVIFILNIILTVIITIPKEGHPPVDSVAE